MKTKLWMWLLWSVNHSLRSPAGKEQEGKEGLWLNPRGQNFFWFAIARGISGGEGSASVKECSRNLSPVSFPIPLPCFHSPWWDWRNDTAVRNTHPSGLVNFSLWYLCAMGSLLKTHFWPVPSVVCGLSTKLVRMQWREGPSVLQGVLWVIPLSQPPRKAAHPDRGDVMGSLSNRLWVH